jgi:hypothetical protein
MSADDKRGAREPTFLLFYGTHTNLHRCRWRRGSVYISGNIKNARQLVCVNAATADETRAQMPETISWCVFVREAWPGRLLFAFCVCRHKRRAALSSALVNKHLNIYGTFAADAHTPQAHIYSCPHKNHSNCSTRSTYYCMAEREPQILHQQPVNSKHNRIRTTHTSHQMLN